MTAGGQDSLRGGFPMHPGGGWRFLGDAVMGGVSTGQVRFLQEDGRSIARLTGQVRTANNGGFLQIRRDLTAPPPADATGVRLLVRGNDQRYFVHLRTRATVRPWQYHRAGFDVTRDWSEVHLPFSGFAAAGGAMQPPRPDTVTSVGIVAFGRDHDAEIDIAEAGFL